MAAPADATLVLHVSDLHARGAKGAREHWARLERALRIVRDEASGPVGLVATGDICDSSKLDPDLIRDEVGGMLDTWRAALGPQAPIALLPGNHDRREEGVISPWSTAVMDVVADLARTRPGVTVHAPRPLERLAAPLAELSAALDIDVVGYDTTFTPTGKFSAGGTFRSEDFFAVRPQRASDDGRPLVVLMHHHIIPTPVTDFGRIATYKVGAIERALIDDVLPRLVSFANHEELFMTALGAGTALSVLHSLGRPVIVLHGHKHYPTVRLVQGTAHGDGDVVLAAAGSAGLTEEYRVGADTVGLWPSFNALWIRPAEIAIEAVHFSPRDGTKALYRRDLLAADRDGVAFRGKRVAPAPTGPHKAESDRVVFTLSADGPRWTLDARRDVRLTAGTRPRAYREEIVTLEPGRVDTTAPYGSKSGGGWIEISPGTTVTYTAPSALCRTAAEARERYGVDDYSPFEWVGLTVREPTTEALLVLAGLPADDPRYERGSAFGTVTDLHTGEQRALPILVDADGAVRLRYADCPARRLLRIYWRLPGS